MGGRPTPSHGTAGRKDAPGAASAVGPAASRAPSASCGCAAALPSRSAGAGSCRGAKPTWSRDGHFSNGEGGKRREEGGEKNGDRDMINRSEKWQEDNVYF